MVSRLWKQITVAEITYDVLMLADRLTKSMSPDPLVEAMMTGRFDMRPTVESLMMKEKNRACRKAAKQTAKVVRPSDGY